MGVAPVTASWSVVSAALLLIVLVSSGCGASARKLMNIEESIREDPDLSEVLRPVRPPSVAEEKMRQSVQSVQCLVAIDPNYRTQPPHRSAPH